MTPTHSSSADRVMLAASAAVALLAVVTRLHDVAAYPAIHDWDAGGHAVNVIDLLEMHWPNPRSWCGSHPPLFYALSALLAVVLPESVPIHVTMRALSAAAWITTVGIVWRYLRRLGDRVDAAVVAAVLLGMPGLVIASCMMTNDALCALFVTATLVRLLETPRDALPSTTHVALTGALAGLAATTKATGVAAIGMAAAVYAWRARHDPKGGLRVLVVFGIASAAFAVPHYARVFWSVSGSAYDILAVRAGSQEKEVIATLVHAIAREHTRFSSFAALFHTAIWGDPTEVFLPRAVETHPLGRAVWAGGLMVTAVAVAGALRAVVRRGLLSSVAVALVFGVSFAAALAPHAIDRPYIVLTKTNYMLPEALPVGILLAFGLGWVPMPSRAVLRVALLVVATGGLGLTFYDWWAAAAAPAGPRIRSQATGSAARVVDRYFEYWAHDPVRALRLLTPEVQLAHDLRLSRILGLPPLPPEPGVAPEDERSLELARARVAWLELHNLIAWTQPIASAFDVDVLAASEHDGTADVLVQVAAIGPAAPPGGDIGLWPFPTFDQHFKLERDSGEWRISGIDQRNVVNENAVQAFVASPTMAGFEHLRAIGWQPPWQAAVASVLHDLPVK